MMNYRKYAWIGNKVTQNQMAQLHFLSKKVKRPITVLMKEAVDLYLIKKEYLFLEMAEESTDMIPSSL